MEKKKLSYDKEFDDLNVYIDGLNSYINTFEVRIKAIKSELDYLDKYARNIRSRASFFDKLKMLFWN